VTQVLLQNVRVRFAEVEVLKDVSLEIASHELVALLGPSGCGKTTLLRAIAGFVRHEGDLIVGGERFNEVPAHRRGMGLVFQDYALFPHKTVNENIGFGPRLLGRSRDEIAKRVNDLVRMLQLDGMGERYPSQLSGGQRQRVALARALAIDPKMLLLDEPLSALDRKLREEMQIELRLIQKRVGITALFVTHDQEEALALADRIVVMNGGRVIQVGTPEQVYQRPADRFVATFIGKSNIFEARCLRSAKGRSLCALPGGAQVEVPGDCGGSADESVYICVRPESIRLWKSGAASEPATIGSGEVMHVVYMGTHQELRVRMEDGTLVDVRTQRKPAFSAGERVELGWAPEDSVLLAS
jgi:spermidine/putrescine ABC transporter ATP-binding subunit